MLDGISASLDVGSASTSVETGLGELEWSFLGLDGHLDHLDVLLHVRDLLKHLRKVTAKLLSLVLGSSNLSKPGTS